MSGKGNKVKSSPKRILGAAFFGFILVLCFYNASQFTIPKILAMVQEIDVETARSKHESSIILSLLVTTITSFSVAALAAFIGRQRGILVGLLANSVYALIFLLGIYFFRDTDESPGNISLQLGAFLLFLSVILASILGGLFGEKYYSPDKDLDLGKDKLTIFGIHWPHYFWILPFIFYPFLASFVIIVYAGILTYLVDFYFAIHPSLWFNIAWWGYFFVIPMAVLCAGWVAFAGFIRFYEIMQYKQTELKRWKKSGQVLLYGMGTPLLSYAIASFAAFVTHNMPQPATGDWKVGLILILIILTIIIIVSFISWIKETVFQR